MDPKWSTQDAAEYYLVNHWGQPFFSVGDTGNLMCHPSGGAPTVDLKALVDDLRRRGFQAPILVRFNDILEARLAHLHRAFESSIAEYEYAGAYQSVMPIKVNQQRHVVEELVARGRQFNIGLEAGSKPELIAAIALLECNGIVVCNGYKDAEYVETALQAQKLGLTPMLVLDRFEELDIVITAAKKLGVRPHIGMRAKLSSRGAGRWEKSSGDRSKFGLSAREMITAVQRLKDEDMLDCLRLLHFHIGSQITAIRSVKDAVREAARVYVDLRRLGASNLEYVDVGGGLAVDYDGSKTNFHSSKNYSVQEYANDVVWTLKDLAERNDVPHPRIITEAGRALVAHHSVLIFDVLGVHELDAVSPEQLQAPAEDAHRVVWTMYDAYTSVSAKNFQESFNDARAAKAEAATLYAHGVIDLSTRAHIDDLYWATCRRVQRATRSAEYVPDDLEGLDKALSDTYYCNFSLFQSIPDAWAVGQLFPIMPIHRLDEAPENDGVLADLTCDSDGRVEKFIDLRDVRDTLRLHAPDGTPYYLGAFLVGAYQEILGDLHNLFGDTNAVHVSLTPDGGYELDHFLEGDSVGEVLGYVEFDRAELLRKVRKAAERAARSGKVSLEESARFVRMFEAGLAGYTYLEDEFSYV